MGYANFVINLTSALEMRLNNLPNMKMGAKIGEVRRTFAL
jgi:hypothetical protein